MASGSRGTRRVTLADVAAAAGVSPAAASFVLNGRHELRIAPATQDRVRAAAQKLGYRPNLAAQSLRLGTTRTIGLVSDLISSTPYAGGMVRGALDAARRKGSLLLMAETLGDADIEAELAKDLLDRRVDGFIYGAMYTRTVRVPEPIKNHRVVLLNCDDPTARVPRVLPAEEQAGETAANEILRAGHRSGIYLVGARSRGEKPYALQHRARGINRALRREGTALAGRLVASEWEPEDGRVAVAELLATAKHPTALICMNDRLAFGAYQALAEAGLRVAEDVSIVSFDDSDLAGWLRPGLTSIGLPHEELGRTAVELLLDNATTTSTVVEVDMPIERRSSVAPPRG